MFESIVGICLISFLALGIRIVKQSNLAIVERMGKFNTVLEPGFNFVIPILDQVVKTMDMKIHEFPNLVQIKTSDNLIVELPIKIQLVPVANQVYKAYYKLSNPSNQITSWILNYVRSITNSMSLQELYEDKNHMVTEIKTILASKLNDFGYEIIDVLVDQPILPEDVEKSFNRVVAAKREAEAAIAEAEAMKIKQNAIAEAEANSQKIRAEGMSQARKILAQGLNDSFALLEQHSIQPQSIIETLIELNRLDVLKDIGSHGNLIVVDTKSSDVNTALISKLLNK